MPSTTLGSSHLRLVTTIIYLTTITTTTTMGRVRSDLEKNQVPSFSDLALPAVDEVMAGPHTVVGQRKTQSCPTFCFKGGT